MPGGGLRYGQPGVRVHQVARGGDVAGERAADERDDAAVDVRGVQDLLHPVDVRGEGGDQHAAGGGREDPDQLALHVPHGERRAGGPLLRVGGVGEQQPHAAVAEPREGGQVAAAAADGGVLDAEVARVHDRPRRGLERDGGAVGRAVRERDELRAERADLERLVVRHLHELGVLEQPVLVELRPQQREREATGVDGDLADRPDQERDGADVVLVAVGEDQRLEGVAALHDVGEVRQDDVHAHLVVLGEGDPAVDEHHAAVVLDDVHVLADLPGAPEGDHADRVAHVRWTVFGVRMRTRATGCPAAPGPCEGCRARPGSPRRGAAAAVRTG